MTTEFFLHMDLPTVTQQTHKVAIKKNKPVVVYQSYDLKKARAMFYEALSLHVPQEMYRGATRLITKWLFRITDDKHYDGEWRIDPPDTDNLIKMPKDVMQKLNYFTNDSIVASDIIEKFWSDTPGLYVKIMDLSQPPRPLKKQKGILIL